MEFIALSDLPDVPLRIIFRYLSDLDIYNLGQVGNAHLQEIANGHVELGKQTFCFKSNFSLKIVFSCSFYY